MALGWQRSQGGGCCGGRKQSDGYETGDRSMLRHGKPPFPSPYVRQSNGGVVQRCIKYKERAEEVSEIVRPPDESEGA